MEIDRREDAVARYDALRTINTAHQGAATGLISKPALMTQAKRLGLVSGGAIVAAEDEFEYVFDLCLYTAQTGRTRTIERYARSVSAPAGSDEREVLDAMLDTRFSLWRVEGRHPVAGILILDLARQKQFWLMDHGLEASAPDGLMLGGRLLSIGPFVMTCGVVVTVDFDALNAVRDATACLAARPVEEFVEDRRFATALYRHAARIAPLDLGSWAA